MDFNDLVKVYDCDQAQVNGCLQQELYNEWFFEPHFLSFAFSKIFIDYLYFSWCTYFCKGKALLNRKVLDRPDQTYYYCLQCTIDEMVCDHLYFKLLFLSLTYKCKAQIMKFSPEGCKIRKWAHSQNSRYFSQWNGGKQRKIELIFMYKKWIIWKKAKVGSITGLKFDFKKLEC